MSSVAVVEITHNDNRGSQSKWLLFHSYDPFRLQDHHLTLFVAIPAASALCRPVDRQCIRIFGKYVLGG